MKIENIEEEFKEFNILIADDNNELLKSMESIFSIFFKDVITAKNGKDALKKFRDRKVDFVLTDYIMPEMNGEELCENIRKIDSSIPIAVMSNYSDRERLLKMIPMNLTDYLVKPIEYNEIMELLKKFANRYYGIQEDKIMINKKTFYDTQEKTLLINNEPIKLSKSELAVLEILVAKIGSVVSTDEIAISVDEFEVKSEQAVKNLIHRVRKKIKIDGIEDAIVNVQGIGYTIKKT
ncbi:response regulator with CheY-like receiver domain and winged-helix DNA-binding domain [Thiovulum sp. ES]|nr:response regulator with CheY-like receiver domain and winged-helix DNA-binding domain [Thiovulum sp. ES]